MSKTRVDGRTLRHQHRRPQLLAAATEYVLDHGIIEVSLRDIAAGLGVTHATLLRHFSTKEDLLLEVVGRIRSDFRSELLDDQQLRAVQPVSQLLRLTWTRLCQPHEQRQFILLFELVGRAARQPDRIAALAESLVTDWVDMLAEQLTRAGSPAQDAEELATLLLAQVRGLQLDLLLTGERARVDRALESTIRMVERING